MNTADEYQGRHRRPARSSHETFAERISPETPRRRWRHLNWMFPAMSFHFEPKANQRSLFNSGAPPNVSLLHRRAPSALKPCLTLQ
jgi:hypothetical protein